ncbi:GHKL domain-containing protein [Bacillus salacetis]|uniref:histidine kinase n=1 Tax=Bacillus salacetis TaxID=2315464 RepID=A0A3A1QMK0_9BACI|nr:ATP-binding protein [Bacillus salacetis]RIW28049.1 GHKL domain-containing protein [Bacillus salacetis]
MQLTLHPVNELISNYEFKRQGAHILYMYTDETQYIANAFQYIYEGLRNGCAVLFIDTEEILSIIKEKLREKGLPDSCFKNLICIEAGRFYIGWDDTNVSNASKKLNTLLRPFIESNFSIRTWGSPVIPLHEPNLENIRNYECQCNEFIIAESVSSVCSYNALKTPAYLQNELLKTHTHLMTDETYVKSVFYNPQNHDFTTEKELLRLRQIDDRYLLLKEADKKLIVENSLEKVRNQIIKDGEGKIRNIINKLPIPVIIRTDKGVLFSNDSALENIISGSSKKGLNDSFKICEEQNDKSGQVQEYHFTSEHEPPRQYFVNSIDLLFNNEEAVLHSYIDITKEKENELLIIRSEKKNIAGQLAASIAHELRNPLTAVKGFFQLLKSTSQENQYYYNVIADELSRIEEISNELLTLAKPQAEKRSDHNVVQIVKDVQLLLSSHTNMGNIEMLLDCSEKELFIHCDNNKIKQVFINIIKNAIEAMENGGKIALVIKEQERNVNIRITDQGKGIPEEVLSKLGEPFFTTKEKGTGIGLMVCYQIIENHGGTLEVSSKIDTGTTFSVSLPKNGQVQH